LGRQLQRLHVGHIRKQAGGVFKAQAILDQALKHLREAFGSQASAKVRAAGVIGHLIPQWAATRG
jgi:hypothetical protein